MLDFLKSLGPLAPVAVFLLATGESAAFLGLLLPGEVAVILGGVVAATGLVPLWLMAAVAVVGAILGDSIGYFLGAKAGAALLEKRRMAGLARHLGSAKRFIAKRDWLAIAIARFTSVLRAAVPFAAGSIHMPYGRFLLGNVIGGIAWGLTFTLAGYTAGANYKRVEHWLQTGGLVLAGLIAVIVGLVWSTRWASRNRQAVVRRIRPLLDLRVVTFIVRHTRAAAPVRTLLIAGAGATGALWLFATTVQDVLGRDEFFLLDKAVLRYIEQHPIPPLVTLSRLINAATEPLWVFAGALAIVVIAAFRRRGRIAWAVATVMVGQLAISEVAEQLIQRQPPAFAPLAPRIDYGFPSEHVAAFTALAVILAWPWSRPRWRVGVQRVGAAAMLIVLVTTARIVLLLEYPSDVTAGLAVGVAWALLVGLAFDSIAAMGTARRLRKKKDP